ncbi:YciI family protein [Flagellimonas olearia]|nr:YciI family protein [Allomuricauda olearia]
MKTKVFLLFALFSSFLLTAQTPSDYTIVFTAQAKVNIHENKREAVNSFFGTALGRRIDAKADSDWVYFDGGGFVKFAYHSDENMVLDTTEFIKSMQLGLLVPSTEYEAVQSIIKDSGALPMLPEVEKYQDHDHFYYFHAPGGQVFRIVNSATTLPKKGEVLFDAEKAEKYRADDYGMKKYVFAFLKRGPNRSLPKEEADALQMAHLQNIGRMAQEGKLVLAGPFFGNDDLRGIYIFNVSSLEEAKKLTETDPAIQAGSLIMDLKEWYGSAALMEVNQIGLTLAKKSIMD